MNSVRQWIGSLLSLGALLLAGCVTNEPLQNLDAHGLIALPPETKVAGLSATRTSSAFDLRQPLNRSESVTSNISEINESVARGDPYSLLWPVAAVPAALIGAVAGVDRSRLDKMVQSVEAAVLAADLPGFLRSACLRHLGGLSLGEIRVLPDDVPAQPLDPHQKRAASLRHPLTGSDVDIVLGWRISQFGFRQRERRREEGGLLQYNEANPPLQLRVTFELTAVRVRDWSHVGGLTLVYDSDSHNFTTWAADDARLLRQDLEKARELLARQMVARLTRAGP